VRITLSSEGKDTAEEVTASSVKKVDVIFTLQQIKGNAWNSEVYQSEGNRSKMAAQ
jgi:hypothetical protein